jgi:hypothetical protein
LVSCRLSAADGRHHARTERSCGNLGAIDRTDIEAFLEELRTYLDHHGIL